MRVAQRLYENGYITYMRTDSTSLSESAIAAARDQARELYGADAVPAEPRHYNRKVKNAQEAHEAIRPAGDRFRTPDEVRGELERDEYALYELVWKRTVASQMADARGETVSVRLGATAADGRDAEFGTAGTVITFRGFLLAYEEGRDEAVAGDDEEQRLPPLAEGDALEARELEPDGHSTTPPPRYTEATLVRALEERGIGRPSTYAAIMGTILDRGYVRKEGQALVPSFLAFAVTNLLEQHFASSSTTSSPRAWRTTSTGSRPATEERSDWLRRFYFGNGEPRASRRSSRTSATSTRARSTRSRSATASSCASAATARTSSATASAPTISDDIAPDELTVERAEELLSQGRSSASSASIRRRAARSSRKNGRYGPYVTEVLPRTARSRARGRSSSRCRPRR